MDDESITQGSVSNRMSFKDRRFSNFDAFNNVLGSTNLNQEVKRGNGNFTGEVDGSGNNDDSPGLHKTKLRSRQKSSSSHFATGPKVGGVIIENFDRSEKTNVGGEANFEEVNLSMQEPYQRKKHDDILAYTDSEQKAGTEQTRAGGVFISPSDKNSFANGLANLPGQKQEGQAAQAVGGGQQSRNTNASNQLPQDEAFNNALQYWLTCIGYAVGYGNIWRFPYLLYSNGGGAFLVPYFLSVCLIAIPMYMVETAFGQCYRKQLSQRFGSISPKLWGFSFAQLIVCTMNNLYYVVLMAWSVAYLLNSFDSPLPWVKRSFINKSGDDFDVSTLDEEAKQDQAAIFFNKDFFSKKMLEETDSISESGGLVPLIVGSLAIAYVLIYFSIWKGVESTGKVVYFTALLPYVLLIILLIRGLTLEGSGSGLYYLFYPDWSKLGNAKVWRDGVNQVIFSSGIAFGPLVFYSSCRQPNEKILRSSFWLPIINSGTSILAAMVLFTFLGHVSTKLGISIDEIQIEGIELAFVAYPAMLSMLPGSNIWAVIFFVMLIVIGIDSIFATFDFVMSFLHSEYPIIGQKLKKEQFSLIIVLLNFLFGLIFCLRQGIYIFQIFDHYAVGLPLLFLELANTLILGWKFDMLTLDQLMYNATGERFPKPLFYIVRYGLVAIMTVSFIVSFIAEFENPLELPGWALFFGWVLMLAPIVLSLLGFCFTKKRIFCCCDKYASKPVSQIEYAHDMESEQKQRRGGQGGRRRDGDDDNDIEEDRVVHGELEMRANIKLGKMLSADKVIVGRQRSTTAAAIAENTGNQLEPAQSN